MVAQSLVSGAIYTFTFNGIDAAGNLATAVTNTGVTFDNIAPSISIGAPSALSTKGGPVTYTITYADTNFSTSTLASANITLNTTGTATGTIGVDTGTGLTRIVSISSITGNGTLGISIAAGTANDKAGNLSPASSASTTFTVDNIAPSVSWIAPVTDGLVYVVGNQSIQLKVDANDNVGIYKVVFYRWDYLNSISIEIGTVYNTPYSLNFDTSGLLPGWNEIDAYAYDAGNNSSSKYIWLNAPILTVNKTGTGGGTVTSIPDGIYCGSTCSYLFASNTVVTLTASPTFPSTFGGWSGACTGTGPCNVTMDAAKSVTANFKYHGIFFLPLIFH
jgi:hypothetical protein